MKLTELETLLEETNTSDFLKVFKSMIDELGLKIKLPSNKEIVNDAIPVAIKIWNEHDATVSKMSNMFINYGDVKLASKLNTTVAGIESAIKNQPVLKEFVEHARFKEYHAALEAAQKLATDAEVFVVAVNELLSGFYFFNNAIFNKYSGADELQQRVAKTFMRKHGIKTYG